MLLSNESSLSGVQFKVSVLVTTYNHEKFIQEAINSVLMQETNFEYEVVIIEDCSSDRTRDIVIDFQRSYPNKFRLSFAQKNHNDNRAWGSEILNARSEFIALLDGDDYWTSPHKLQKQVDFLESHPECSICFHNVMAFYEDGSREPYLFNTEYQKEISSLDDLWEGNFVAGCSAMLRRGLVKELPEWFYSLQWGDWSAYIIWAHHGNIGYLNKVMGAYRIHDRGMWSGLSDHQQIEQVVDFYEVINLNFGFKYNDVIKPLIAKNYQNLARMYAENGDRANAEACLLKAAESL